MRARLRTFLLSSRTWFTAGLICIGGGVAIGYHEDQIDATRAMAQKIGAPAAVLLQDYDSSVNSNMLGEVNVIAEAALDRTVRLDLGRPGVPRWTDVVPLYAVGSTALPLAESVLMPGHARRPMPRSAAQALRAREDRVSILAHAPIGAIVQNVEEASWTDATTLGLDVLGEGDRGLLVRIDGDEISGETISAATRTAFRDAGLVALDGILTVAPHANGRAVPYAEPSLAFHRTVLLLLGTLTVLVGAALVTPARYVRGRKAYVVNKEDTVLSVPSPLHVLVRKDGDRRAGGRAQAVRSVVSTAGGFQKSTVTPGS